MTERKAIDSSFQVITFEKKAPLAFLSVIATYLPDERPGAPASGTMLIAHSVKRGAISR